MSPNGKYFHQECLNDRLALVTVMTLCSMASAYAQFSFDSARNVDYHSLQMPVTKFCDLQSMTSPMPPAT